MRVSVDGCGNLVFDAGLGAVSSVRSVIYGPLQQPSTGPYIPPPSRNTPGILEAKTNVRCVGAPASDDPLATYSGPTTFYSGDVAKGKTTANQFCQSKGFRGGIRQAQAPVTSGPRTTQVASVALYGLGNCKFIP